MKLLLRSAKIIDPTSPFNNKTKDILIINGRIEKIADKISPNSQYSIINSESLCVSPGWLDLYCSFGDPGFEYKEDMESGTKAAAAGGFTGVALLPDTHPAIHSKAEIEYLKKRANGNLVDVFPIGAVTHQREGKELAEIMDMREAGAIAFSDADHPIGNAGLFLRAMLYVKPFGGIIYSHTEEKNISNNGTIHEGKTSTQLGLRGIPSVAEELMVVRDVYLAEYTGSKVHFPHVSTKKSVELIRNAKNRGVKVTASVAPYHLLYDDSMLNDYDVNLKVSPPLRTKEDVKALLRGVADGTIDAICSNHAPQDEDVKKVEFEYAEFGMVNLQTCFSLALQAIPDLPVLVDKLAIQPRKILGLKIPSVRENEPANLTVFNPKQEWTFTEKDVLSKSKNSPFLGKKLKGKVIGVVNNSRATTY